LIALSRDVAKVLSHHLGVKITSRALYLNWKETLIQHNPILSIPNKGKHYVNVIARTGGHACSVIDGVVISPYGIDHPIITATLPEWEEYNKSQSKMCSVSVYNTVEVL
ncbi:MAG: hypothetical protein L0Y56_20665, partial [Nitrospira sp.]|nr:hypothetical protein [Nitrospira sp.]